MLIVISGDDARIFDNVMDSAVPIASATASARQVQQSVVNNSKNSNDDDDNSNVNATDNDSYATIVNDSALLDLNVADARDFPDIDDLQSAHEREQNIRIAYPNPILLRRQSQSDRHPSARIKMFSLWLFPAGSYSNSPAEKMKLLYC